MKTFILKFKHGIEIEIEADSFICEPGHAKFFDSEGNEMLTYRDSEIVSCEEKE